MSNTWVDDLGLNFDRRFVLTDLKGKFITARTKPTLCLVQASLTAQGIILTAPHMPNIAINYQDLSNHYQPVTVWKDEINSQHCNPNIDKWFSDYLGVGCKLYFFGEQSKRSVANADKQVGFADGYPLLLISQASLNDLNNRIDNDEILMSQFRPNIVVDDTEAFAEDSWHHIQIGEVQFEVVKPCSRCVLTTVDPKTGIRNESREPLSTLKQYRRVSRGEVMFGQNLIALNQGQIKQGDEVTILSYQKPPEFVES